MKTFYILILIVFTILFLVNKSYAQATNQEIHKGSYIINMGVSPQTKANGLKPYGLIYELIKNRIVPVKWVINQTKTKDGIDFHHNGTFYKGGTFVIEKEFITPTIATLITTWNGLGVVGAYSNYDTVLPVYATLSSWPRSLMDLQKGYITAAYYANAGVPTSAYTLANPSSADPCNDIFILPHADPTWTNHGNLYTFVTANKGYVWAACHAVSVLESIKNPAGTIQLNFLTDNGLQCFGSGRCNAVTEIHNGTPTAPNIFNPILPKDPIGQYIGLLSPATTNGSEQWFIPLSTGTGWNADVKKLINTSDGTANKEGVILAYGNAYGNPANGKVMYTAGHDHDGTAEANVAAQRSMFNFILLTGEEKKPVVQFSGTNDTLVSGNTLPFSANVSNGTGPYTYQWTSTAGGVFSNPTSASTNYTVPMVADSANIVIRCQVTDACSRFVFQYQAGKIYTAFVLTNGLLQFNTRKVNETAKLNWKLSDNHSIEKIEIERSLNGKDFEMIAQQSATSVTGEYTDASLPVSKAIYYRLKTTTKGKITYSQINKIYSENINAITLYPNPAKSFVRLSGLSTTGKTDIRIVDLSGVTLIQKSVQTTDGTYQVNGLDQLKQGVYTVEINMSGMKKREKLVVGY